PTADRKSRPEQEVEFAEIAAALGPSCTFGEKADAVATLQQVFNETVSDFLTRSMERFEVEKLALGGGCALNVLLNTQLRDELKIDLHIAPACNDSGQALGAAVYAQMFHLGIRPSAFSVYSNGLPPDACETASLLRSSGLSARAYSAEAAASVLASGGVVAFCTGVSEIGPRALGNRSLLADPSVPGMRERVSVRLKGRESFRPLSPVMRQERFRELLPSEPDSPHMLYAYNVGDEHIREAVHVDGTARIQTVKAEDNPRLHALLEAFEELTGVPALINTSLNAQGRAIAYRPADVLDDFGASVDLFVFDDVMATRGGTV
ncbi:MAG TPA: carbamoyltransferase C-terminal domain-containing protein, partial [Pyrinomonadaceae bacterium]|nr:carbamoyltransferase C-terminal domain-containing protein [Pyrinomonadaceae bacterium]